MAFIRPNRDKLCKSSTQCKAEYAARALTHHIRRLKEMPTTINHVIVFVYVVDSDSGPCTRFYMNLSIEADGAEIDSKSAFSWHHRWDGRGRFAYVRNGSNNV